MNQVSSGSSSSLCERASPAPSISQLYGINTETDDTYRFALRLLVLEYINEPRFRSKYVAESTAVRKPSPLAASNYNKRASWFSNGSSMLSRESEESDAVQKTLPKLEKYLSNVAINNVAIRDGKLRRSLLKFYNDVFLNPEMSRTLEAAQGFEEIIVYFTKASNGELNKLVVENIHEELYCEISYFIDLIIKLAADDLPANSVSKLQEYKETVKPRKVSLKKYSTSAVISRASSPNLVEVSTKPAFKLKEITHSSYFMDLFQVSSITLQQDVIKVMDEAVNAAYCKELRAWKEKTRAGKGRFNVENFPSEREFKLWEFFEIGEIASLLDRFESDEAGVTNGNDSPVIIPPDARNSFVSLVSRILLLESKQNVNSLNLSQSALFFITKASKYWRLNYHSTLASLIYTAANLTILSGEEINLNLAENLLNFIRLKVLKVETNMETSLWNDLDRKQWSENLLYSANQCSNMIDNLLTALFASTKPKFSKALSFYYCNIKEDPCMTMDQQQSNILDRQMLKRFRKTVFKTSERFYISLLDQVPKDSTIKIQHIQNVAEQIIEQIKSIQKRYNKPLLDKINLAFECSTVLIEAFGSDISAMVKRAKKYGSVELGQPIAPVDALEAYSVFKELRSIYKQVRPNNSFPCNLEKLFVKYVTQLCDEVSQKVLKVIESSIQNETWEFVNPEVPFSNSVLDIFKMINESINLFKKLDWQEDYQIAKVITFLLKSFSDGLLFYTNTLLRMIEEDLIQDAEHLRLNDKERRSVSGTRPYMEKAHHSWSFHGMKNALRSSQVAEIPGPYQFKNRTCVLLSNFESMIQKLNDLDEQINAEQLSKIVQAHEGDNSRRKNSKDEDTALHQLYTIRIIKAKGIKGFSKAGLSNALVSIVDTSKHHEIGKTKLINNTINPMWDEEFEIETPVNKSQSLTMMVWHRPSGRFNSFSSYELCGKCSILLEPKKFSDDGFPNEVTLQLDTQGKLYLEIALESEKVDALFAMGRTYRTLTRARDRAIELIISKFSACIGYAFSRTTLEKVCGSHGTLIVSKNEVYEAIVPLFDYLNSNLNILASSLSQDLLFKIMLRAWSCILQAADALLLPPLSIARNKRLSGSKSFFGSAVSAALHNTYVVPGYGRALTLVEVETVFSWLYALCVDFFHNGGEGPPLSDLKNSHYQTMLLIAAYYDKNANELKQEVERLSPSYAKYINKLAFGLDNHRRLSNRLVTLARKETIMANASKKARLKIQQEIEQDQNDSLERSSETLDIVFRILLVKGEADFVSQQLAVRSKMKKSVATEKLVKAAVQGQRLKYKH
ncbi:hypothetical protein HG536_0D01430 [Torulaspora globosa]|uniref:C2 domain-containing protein n=1 Tax=Torulaspora globosa TaxID=48254 RepID=A0A7G3ZGI5_9SACH|nr:uncharacterized protein HG536_0D01430 [Torulaspora globosa]QLL32621.1 hypothetical protein HG536_0D01430 [Torulaspora globosa]